MTLSVFQATITNESGDILPGAEVSVILESTGLAATIYSTRGGAALSNPFFADASGFAQFYANAGEYRIIATSGVFSRTWRYVRLGDGGAKDVGTAATKNTDELVTPVNSVADLTGFAGTKDDQQISLKGWHPDSDVGGGILYWDAAKPKSEHNGGTVFSPTVPFSATTGDYLDGVGETDAGGAGCWVRGIDGELSLHKFGALGDGATLEDASLDAATSALVANGNEGTLYIPKGTFRRSTPWELPQGVSLRGEGQDQSVIKKTSTVVDSRGRNSVIVAYDKNRFRIKDIGTIGDKNIGVAGTSYGIMLQGCSYFRVDNVRNWLHKHGMYIKTCWLCNIDSPVSQQCESYGYQFETACTSITLTGPTSWGCGGHVRMVGVLYSVINSGACDQSDAGGFPSDPFLPIGSGGDYQNPNCIFSITSSQGITINSPGTESGYSKYLYMEGSQVVMNTPYCFSLEGHSTNWNFIELRGTGRSDLLLNAPWFTGINNTLSPAATRRGIYVENSRVQKVRLSNMLTLNDTFGDYKYSYEGIEYTNTRDMVRMDQNTMQIGGESTLIPDPSGTVTINNVAGVKIAVLASTADSTYFKVPLPERGTIKIHTRGSFSSGFDVLRMQVREVGGAVLKEWTSINTDDYYEIDSVGTPVEFAIRRFKSGETVEFTELVIEHIL